MKKFLSLMAIAAMLFTFTACGGDDDEPENNNRIERRMSGIVVKTMTNGKPTNFSSCVLTFIFDFKTKLLNMGFYGISFAPRMPQIDFAANGLKINSSNNDLIDFSGTGILVMEGYTLNNVQGLYDSALNSLILSYTVNSDHGQYDILSFSPILYSTLAGGGHDYDNATEKFYKFKHLFSNDEFTAHICIDNIQFVAQMPKLEEIVIPLDEAAVIQTAKGYTAAAETIVPYFKQGDKLIPFSDRTINNLNFELNVRDRKFSIEFDCYGLHYTDSGSLMGGSANIDL